MLPYLSYLRNYNDNCNRWAKDCGLTKMGFGREKTTYCYYAIAAATTYPNHSYVRTLVAKSAILITIADDFFDTEGSLRELKDLMNAVRRYMHIVTVFPLLKLTHMILHLNFVVIVNYFVKII